MEGFIKLSRKMLKWEWYDDINTKVLFIHCLLKANWKAGSWHGVHYEAGQFITSLRTLSAETHLSIKQVRTALDHLKTTNEVADYRQGNFRIITVVKWNEYQGKGIPTGRLGATDKEYKEYKEKKKRGSPKSFHNFTERVIDYSQFESFKEGDRNERSDTGD